MPRRNAEELFKAEDVILVDGKPAMVTRVEHSSVYYAFIDKDGKLHGGHWFSSWAAEKEGIKHVDGATVETVVALPKDLQACARQYTAPPEKMRGMEWEPEKHPSYGAITVSRVSGHTSLFQSPFKHQHYMSLRIHRATRHRDLAYERLHPGFQIVEISLSEAQWARMVSSAGMGDGIPCTIEHVLQEQMPDCPVQAERERFHADVEKSGAQATKSLDGAIAFLETLMDKPSITKAERKELMGKLSSARSGIASAMPFIVKMMQERIEHVVSEGKTEIEAFLHKTVQNLGMEALLGKVKPPMELAETSTKDEEGS